VREEATAVMASMQKAIDETLRAFPEGVRL
jgi:hypothetical protein